MLKLSERVKTTQPGGDLFNTKSAEMFSGYFRISNTSVIIQLFLLFNVLLPVQPTICQRFIHHFLEYSIALYFEFFFNI
jgi:hypothetical protein